MAENRYDSSDIIRRVFLMNASGLKFASYQVRDMAAAAHGVESFGSLQHHLTYVPVKSIGHIGEVEQVLVNEIGATIYAMLEDEQVDHLREVIEKIEAAGEDFQKPRSFVDVGLTRTAIQAYRHPNGGEVELQILCGAQVLGVLGLGTAKMFCTLASNARAGRPSRANFAPPQGPAEAIAGEVDRALKAPGRTIDHSELDACE